MPSTVDYNRHYREGPDICGAPSPDVVRFCDALPWPRARVLDLGCGQGRDGLLFARAGHAVVGVDLSDIGIRQMREDAAREGLDVTGVVGDVQELPDDGALGPDFDVVLFDRTLHLVPTPAARAKAAADASARLVPGGVMLILDIKANRDAIRRGIDRSRKLCWVWSTDTLHIAQRVTV